MSEVRGRRVLADPSKKGQAELHHQLYGNLLGQRHDFQAPTKGTSWMIRPYTGQPAGCSATQYTAVFLQSMSPTGPSAASAGAGAGPAGAGAGAAGAGAGPAGAEAGAGARAGPAGAGAAGARAGPAPAVTACPGTGSPDTPCKSKCKCSLDPGSMTTWCKWPSLVAQVQTLKFENIQNQGLGNIGYSVCVRSLVL